MRRQILIFQNCKLSATLRDTKVNMNLLKLPLSDRRLILVRKGNFVIIFKTNIFKNIVWQAMCVCGGGYLLNIVRKLQRSGKGGIAA